MDEDNIAPEYRKSQKHKGRYNRYKTGGSDRCKKINKKEVNENEQNSC